jgi:hypothetical protein
MAAATGDRSFRARVDYMVAELAKCQDALNLDGYLAAFPVGAFDRLEGKPGESAGVVVPYYTIHKIMAGLLDAYLNMPRMPVPELRAASENPADWLEPVPAPGLQSPECGTGRRNPLPAALRDPSPVLFRVLELLHGGRRRLRTC